MDPSLEEKDKSDKRLIDALPYLVTLCAIGGALNIILLDKSESVGSALVAFCEAYVLGFFFLGVYAFIYRESGSIRNKIPVIFFAIGPVLAAIVSYWIGLYVVPDIFSSEIFDYTDNAVQDVLTTAAKLYLIMLLTVMVVFGVVSVVSSCFRQYSAQVFNFISRLKNDGTDTGRGRFALKFYEIPDIITIKSVEMEPTENENFSMEEFISMSISVFALCIVICSYLFLNPVFMREMTFYEVLMIGILISFFVPVLVVPWYITKETGAKIKNDSRDLYLWKGMKKRLYQSFFGFTMVLLLMILSLYLGTDLMRITYTYIGYVAFLAFMSMFYAYVFFNNFNNHLKKDIVRKFRQSNRTGKE